MGRLGREAVRITWILGTQKLGVQWVFDMQETKTIAEKLWSGKQQHQEAVREAELFNHLLG